jgi:hypothetical protein
LLIALKDNISKFESVHGHIKESDTQSLPLNFGGPTAQA